MNNIGWNNTKPKKKTCLGKSTKGGKEPKARETIFTVSPNNGENRKGVCYEYLKENEELKKKCTEMEKMVKENGEARARAILVGGDKVKWRVELEDAMLRETKWRNRFYQLKDGYNKALKELKDQFINTRIENEAEKQEFYYEMNAMFKKVVKDMNIERKMMSKEINCLKKKNIDRSTKVCDLRNKLKTNTDGNINMQYPGSFNFEKSKKF